MTVLGNGFECGLNDAPGRWSMALCAIALIHMEPRASSLANAQAIGTLEIRHLPALRPPSLRARCAMAKAP